MKETFTVRCLLAQIFNVRVAFDCTRPRSLSRVNSSLTSERRAVFEHLVLCTQHTLFARAETDFCTRQCCGPQRPFTIKVLDNAGREVMRASRPCRCQSCCCPCASFKISCFVSKEQVLYYFTGTVLKIEASDNSKCYWQVKLTCKYCRKTVQLLGQVLPPGSDD